jgi:DNA-binding MarR family transcriptional regulator
MTGWTSSAAALTEVILEVFRVNGDLIAAGDGIAGEFGQSSARWQVLGQIEAEPKTVPVIAREMGLTRQSVQRNVDLLESEGIVEYLDNPAHRRSRLVALSTDGRKLYRRLQARQVRWATGLVDEMDVGANDIGKTLATLRRLRVALEKDR